ncbi:MAG: DUF58 domain-containing protein [Mangrovibacterium sp.]
MFKNLRNIRFSNRFFIGLLSVVMLFILSYPFAWVYFPAQLALLVLIAVTITDAGWLMLSRQRIEITRKVPARLSLGDDNPVSLSLLNTFPFKVRVEVIEELPVEFQKRDFSVFHPIAPGEEKIVDYLLRPLTRGEYRFGQTNVFVSTRLGFISRGIHANNTQSVPVFPSFISMHRFELMGISDRLEEMGIKRTRRIGQHSEFDQVREYVRGDDPRTVNWKATARKSTLMVNQYQDQRSQQVISMIDMGRVMEMPFEGMSLLDYAINASLIISNMAMIKHDRAGLITFSDQVHSLIPAERKGGHLQRIMQGLYNQQTDFRESSYEKLYLTIAQRVKQRSLLILYTNFEGLPSLDRQLPFLRKIAAQHLLLVVFFENTEIRRLAEQDSRSTEEIYVHALARKFIRDKKVIANKLRHTGIMPLLTPPEGLSVNLINKYLEIKAREMI